MSIYDVADQYVIDETYISNTDCDMITIDHVTWNTAHTGIWGFNIKAAKCDGIPCNECADRVGYSSLCPGCGTDCSESSNACPGCGAMLRICYHGPGRISITMISHIIPGLEVNEDII